MARKRCGTHAVRKGPNPDIEVEMSGHLTMARLVQGSPFDLPQPDASLIKRRDDGSNRDLVPMVGFDAWTQGSNVQQTQAHYASSRGRSMY